MLLTIVAWPVAILIISLCCSEDSGDSGNLGDSRDSYAVADRDRARKPVVKADTPSSPSAIVYKKRK
jgi:hypothetical protein